MLQLCAELVVVGWLAVSEERLVCQFHYSAWPDHGVPSSVVPLLRMIRMLRDTQASETLPLLVHCSAGCGRTGTVCAIDYVWGLLKAGVRTERLPGNPDLENALRGSFLVFIHAMLTHKSNEVAKEYVIQSGTVFLL